MKNKYLHVTCRHTAGTPPAPLSTSTSSASSNPDGTPTSSAAVGTLPASASITVSASAMGLQPLTHALVDRLAHLADCTPACVDCSCVVQPRERTILHGILTGQGHKYGYGDGRLWYAGLHQNHNNGLYLHLQPLDNSQKDESRIADDSPDNNSQTTVHSHEVTTPSKCTIQPPDK